MKEEEWLRAKCKRLFPIEFERSLQQIFYDTPLHFTNEPADLTHRYTFYLTDQPIRDRFIDGQPDGFSTCVCQKGRRKIVFGRGIVLNPDRKQIAKQFDSALCVVATGMMQHSKADRWLCSRLRVIVNENLAQLVFEATPIYSF
jgi:hypothetical protein